MGDEKVFRCASLRCPGRGYVAGLFTRFLFSFCVIKLCVEWKCANGDNVMIKLFSDNATFVISFVK